MPKKSSGTKPSKKILDNKKADAVSVSPNVVRTTKAKIVQPIKDTPVAKRKIVPEVRKTKLIVAERPTLPSSLPEILGAAGDVPKISTPVPRTGPAQPNSVLERMLNIKWSKFIPATKIPTVKQIAAMMMAHKKELMFGGALGGGKSEWLAMEALRYCDLPSFSAIIFRRQLTDLKMPGSLIPRIAGWMQPHVDSGVAKYSGDEHKWTFKTCYPNTDIPGPDATLQFGYIGEATIRDRYQSAEFQLCEFEELGQWPDDVDYLFMHTRLRKIVCPNHGKMADGTPIYVPKCPYCDTLSAIDVRLRSASNPGPAWMKRRFGIIPDPSIYKTRHDALVAIQEGHKIHWIGSNPERPFIASYLDDNPHLNAKDYKQMLKEMSEEERSRLEDGNWEARKDARFKRKHEQLYYLNAPPQYLKAFATEDPNDHVEPIDLKQCSYSFIETDRQGNEVVSDPIPLSSLSEIFTTVDTAVTVRQGPIDSQLKQKNSASVISTWGITHDHALLYLNLRKFRKEIPDLVDNLVQVNNIWQVRRNKVECNGVGVGTAQYSEAAGLRIEKIYQQSDKIHNSTGAQMLMRAGRVFFPANAEWLETAEDDIFSWTGLPAEDDDVIDTLSNASSELSLAAAPTYLLLLGNVRLR